MTTPEPPPADPAGTLAPPPAPERRLHPWSWLFVLLQQMRQFIVPLLVLVFLGRGDGDALWPLIGVAALAAASVWQYFTYRYRVDEDRLVVRQGILERQVRQVPFARIHNVALHQSLLHRLFGVAEVRLESAGGTRPEAEMRVLRLDEALALERLIRIRGGAATHATPADAGPAGTADVRAEPDDGRLLLALSFGELVRLGLVSNRGMVVVAGAFALAWQALPDQVMANAVEEATRQAMDYADTVVSGLHARAVALAMLLALALAGLRLLSVLLALVQYHGFRLLLQGRRLTVERGLLTRLRTSVQRRRIQAWTLHEGLLHRLLRRRSLHVDTAAGAGQGGEQRGLREVAPIATAEACDQLVRELLPGAAWPPVGWRRLHPRAWQRLALPGVGLAVAVAAAACWRFGPPGLLALAWAPWAVHAARQHALRAGYALDGQLLAVREGWWSRHWRFAGIDKIQALRLQRSPLDRAFGMASLWLDTAGARSTAPMLRLRFLPEAEARALHATLAREVARRPLRW